MEITNATHLILGLAIFVTAYIGTRYVKKREVEFITFPAITAIEEGVSRCLELAKPVVITGGYGGKSFEAGAMAAYTYLGYVSKMTAEKKVPIVCVTQPPESLPYIYSVMQQSYGSDFSETQIYYAGGHWATYRTAEYGVIRRMMPGLSVGIPLNAADSISNVEAGLSVGALNVGGANRIISFTWGYMPFCFIGYDYFLIGEEVLAAAADISKDEAQMGTIIGEDWLKLGILAVIIVGLIASMAGL